MVGERVSLGFHDVVVVVDFTPVLEIFGDVFPSSVVALDVHDRDLTLLF